MFAKWLEMRSVDALRRRRLRGRASCVGTSKLNVSLLRRLRMVTALKWLKELVEGQWCVLETMTLRMTCGFLFSQKVCNSRRRVSPAFSSLTAPSRMVKSLSLPIWRFKFKDKCRTVECQEVLKVWRSSSPLFHKFIWTYNGELRLLLNPRLLIQGL